MNEWLDLANATGTNQKGKVYKQQGEKQKRQVICFRCNKEGHKVWNCPEGEGKVCWSYQKGHCKRGDKCPFKHEKQQDEEDEDTDYQSFLRFKKFQEKAKEENGKANRQSGSPYWPEKEEPRPWEQKTPFGE